MPGKAPPESLRSHVFSRLGADDDAVRQGPAEGEDAAAIDVPEGTLIVSSDPISLAASDVGTLGVHVACNDVAVSGGDPRWLTVVALLTDEAQLEEITRDIDTTAAEIGVSIVGGHTEYVDQLTRPMLSLTAMGVGDYIPTGGASPGETVILTAGAGIEGTAILAADFCDELGVDEAVCKRGKSFLDEISVLPAARQLRAHATAMHDPTEGGILAGLIELARASNVDLEVDRESIPVRPETDQLCVAAEVDPLRIFGSGAILATVPDQIASDAIRALKDEGIEVARIGTVHEGAGEVRLNGKAIKRPVRDDLYTLWEQRECNSE